MRDYKVYLLDLDYITEEGQSVLRLFCKNAGGESVTVRYSDFLPYLYVLPEEGEKDLLEEKLADLSFTDNGEEIKTSKVVREVKKVDKEKREIFKVFTSNPSNIPKIKDEVKEWKEVEGKREFDIPFYKRFLIDKGISPFSPLRVKGKKVESESEEEICLLADEIEQLEEEGNFDINSISFDLETYQGEIIMLSLYSDSYRKVYARGNIEEEIDYLEVKENEKGILKAFIEDIRSKDVDILFGYNSDDFDFDILRERAEENNIELELGKDNSRMVFVRRGRTSSAKITGRVHLDLYRFIETIISRTLDSETLTLDNVCEELLGEKKDDMNWEDIREAWEEKKNLGELVKYSLRDSELAYKLGENLLPQIVSLTNLVGIPAFDAIRSSYGQLVENFLIRESHHKGLIVPNRPKRSDVRSRRSENAYKGGFVYEPEEGLHENIALLDFRSLYPSIILSYNISPDTLNDEDCEEDIKVEVDEEEYSFCQEEPGFIPETLEDLIKERYELKKEMKDLNEDTERYTEIYSRQYALKILANSFYGYLGYSGARWYSRPCASSTTALGRNYIHKTISKAEEQDLEVLYGDTDSVFLKGEKVKDKITSFQDKINSELPKFMELELEDFYTRGLFTSTKSGKGAKKRYALLREDGKIKITGFEKVRRDWSKLAKDTQEKVIQKVLENEIEAAEKTVQNTVKELREGKVSLRKLVIYTRLTKSPENYESTSPHVEAAKRAIARGINIEPGDTIRYVITKGQGEISDKAEILRFADSYDPEYYIERQIIPAALRVMKIMGYEKNDFLLKGRQSGLNKFT